MNSEFYRDAIIKIKTKNTDGDTTKIFTGSFYSPENNTTNQTFIITAKHCIVDDDIQTLELNYHFDNDAKKESISLKDFDLIEHPKLDLCIIKIKKQIVCNWKHRIYKNDIIFKNINTNIIFNNVIVPGFYDEIINVPIYEQAQLCSHYNNIKFYVKSKYNIEGYSGAPVLITFVDGYNVQKTYIIGFVSRILENNNIEIISSENIDTIERLINM